MLTASPTDCGSGLYTELEVMPDVTCVKAGGLDDGGAHLGNKIGVEFYTKDRAQYLVVSIDHSAQQLRRCANLVKGCGWRQAGVQVRLNRECGNSPTSDIVVKDEMHAHWPQIFSASCASV